MKLGKSLIIALLLPLAACSGGSSSESVNNDAGGIWVGTVTDASATTYQTVGIIKENGQMRFISDDGEQTTGAARTNGDTFTASVTGYAPVGQVFLVNGLSEITGTARGTITPQSRLTGTVNYQGTPVSTFDFTYDLAYERGASCSDLAGTYQSTEGTYTETYVIDNSCQITGGDSDGCTFSGAITIDDSQYNVYNMRLDVGNCGNVGGTFNGFGSLIDDVSINDTFAVQIENSLFILSGTITRI